MGIKAEIAYIEPANLEQDLREYFLEEIARVMPSIARDVKSHLIPMIDTAIRKSEEWDSLIGGRLREEFGLPNAPGMLGNVLDAILSSVEVHTTKPNGDILGGIEISVLSDSFLQVLTADGAEYISRNKHGVEKAIPWLKWLLLEGNKLILTEYEINTSRASRKGSRTGRAIMVSPGAATRARRIESNPTRSATGWGVPDEFSGTAENNWLTRTIEPVLEQIEPIVEAAFKRI